jgi:MinD-like ATPase involved in chromosome partitioning or flagellar assembly
MSDQADSLRQLVGARRAAATFTALAERESTAATTIPQSTSSRSTESLHYTSGNGGVGTSNVVLNLAIALGERDQRVVVVDADIGQANLDLICGFIGDVHAAINRLGPLAASPPRILLLVNQAASTAQAAEILDRLVVSSRHFQGALVSPLGTGSIRADPNAPLAVRARKPLLNAFPRSLTARSIRRLARALVKERRSSRRDPGAGFFRALAARWAVSLVAGGER